MQTPPSTTSELGPDGQPFPQPGITWPTQDKLPAVVAAEQKLAAASTPEASVAPSAGSSAADGSAATKPTLLLLDGHSLAFRAFYGLPAEGFRTPEGQHTNAVYGFVGMLLGLIARERPTHIAAAFDLAGPTFRADTFPAYKAQRSATPEEFHGQVDLIRRLLPAFGVATIDMPRYEADDIIATLSTQATAEGYRTLICTGDRDSFQLVTEDVTVLYTLKGVRDLATMTPAAVEEKYGVTPTQYPDYAALRGDTSDNMPGVPKCGPVTAQKWITAYGSLDNLLAHADEVKGKVGENLRAAANDVVLARQITEMVRNLPIVPTIADLGLRAPDAAAINALFDELHFGASLRTRVMNTLQVSAVGIAPGSAGAAAGSGFGATLDGSAAGSGAAGAEGAGVGEGAQPCVDPIGVDGLRAEVMDAQAGAGLRRWADRHGLYPVEEPGETAVSVVTSFEPHGDGERLVIALAAPTITAVDATAAAGNGPAASGETATATPENTAAGKSPAASGETATATLENTAATAAGSVDTEPAADHGLLVFALDALTPDDREFFAQWMADPQAPKLTVNAKDSAHALAAEGVELDGVLHDAALLVYVDDSVAGAKDIDTWAQDLFGPLYSDAAEKWMSHFKTRTTSDPDRPCVGGVGWPWWHKAAREAQAVRPVVEQRVASLMATGNYPLYENIEMPLRVILQNMETAGIAVDTDVLDRLCAELTERVAAEESAARSEVNQPELNISSPMQLQKVLFEQLGLPKTKKTKTGYSTAAKELEALAVQNPHPFLEHILRYREFQKLLTAVQGLIKAVAADGRIHTTFKQTVAATGRLSSVDPNVQNIPVRSEEGREIRSAFVAGEGYECLLTADYSQIEMRVLAHLAQDEGIIEAFRSGEDLHNYVGSKVFDVPVTEVDASMRRRVKALSYGLVYGLSDFGLSQQLGISVGEARHIMNTYFERFGGVKTYLDGVVEEARVVGYTETMYGRRRWLKELQTGNRREQAVAERAALNAPIQGTAADIIKLAMIHVDAALRRENLRSRVLLQVHDELVVEVATGELEQVRTLLIREMDQAVRLRVPLEVSVGSGASWADAGH